MSNYKYLFFIFLLILVDYNEARSYNLVKKGNAKREDLLSSASIRRNREDSEEYENGIDEDGLPFVNNEVPATGRPYISPGHWATPAPDSGIDLGFTPVQTYLQVRRTSKVLRLPRSEAVKEASSLDEVLNAHRLKEVLRTKKIQEVYSEEGYEDSGYDHGNHERHAEHDEGFAKHKGGKYKVEEPSQHIQDIANAESQVVEKNDRPRNRKPKTSRKRVETTSMKFAYMNGEERNGMVTNLGPSPSQKHKRAPKVSKEIVEEAPITQKRDFVSPKDDFWNFPSSFEGLTVNKWGANFEPMPVAKKKETKESNRIRIPPVPTFGYIHSLTDAYYGNQAPMVSHHPKPIPSHVINLTEAFNPSPRTTYPGFEPRRVTKRVKREYSNGKTKNEADEYEKQLSKNLDEQEKKIIGSALNNLGVEHDISEKFPYLTPPPPRQNFRPAPLKVGFDSSKYPYYNARGINPYSPLRYASHPREFPVKSGYGMEFYDSRDRAMSCEPISVSLDDEPKENSTQHLSEQPGSKKRIVGLGDKIRCLKIKYFGEDPLDSPFFKEDELKKQTTTANPIAETNNSPKYHSSFVYAPNKTLDIFMQRKPNDSNIESSQNQEVYQTIQEQPYIYNETEQFRVIPVDEFPPEIPTPAPIMGMRPPPMRYGPIPLSIIRLPRRQKPPRQVSVIKYNSNCLHPITKMTISERVSNGEDIVFDCQDVVLMQTMRNGNPHIRIMPKMRPSRRSEMIDMSDDSSFVRAGEVIEGNNNLSKRRKRSAQNTRKKSQLFPNKSLLDKIIKRPPLERRQNETKNLSSADLGVKSPDEIAESLTNKPEVKRTTSTTTTTTVAPTVVSSSEVPIKFEPKPLSRLSGRDFLVRYHKSKSSKNSDKRPDKTAFWNVSATTPRPTKGTTPMRDLLPKPQKIDFTRLKVTPEETSRSLRPKLDKFTPRFGSARNEERSLKKVEERSVSKQEEPSPTPVLLYIVDQTTGRGQWVSEMSTTTEEAVVHTTRKTDERTLKKQNARKTFFAKKLQKNL